MGQLKIAIVDTIDGIPAIRYRDSEGQHPELNLSQRSKSQGNKRAKAILEGRLSPIGLLIHNHTRRIAELLQERKAPLANHPIRWDSKVTFSDYADSIIAVQNREVEWLSKHTYVVVDRRRSVRSRAIRG
jgi:hypothetical protein